MNHKRFICGILALVLVAAGSAYWKLTSPPPSQTNAVPLANPKGGAAQEKARRRLLGIWQDDYKGKRTMTLNEDGTGTMLVQLSGLQATLVAPKLRFDMRWSLEGKTLTKKTVAGDPADKVNLILNTMGNTAEDTILESTDDRLLLLDKDGMTRYDWRRVKHEQIKE